MSLCLFEFTGQASGERFVHRCKACGKEVSSKYRDRGPKANCKVATEEEKNTVSLPAPPLPLAEIDRRIAICEACDKYLPTRKACTICKTCGSGMAIYQGLLRDPTKQCPWPEPLGGSKWGPALPPPLRVAFLTPGLHIGGAERWLASLCSHFDPAKIHAAAVVVGRPQNISPEVKGWFPSYTKIILGTESFKSVLSQIDLLISWGTGDLTHLTAGWGKPIVEVQHGTQGHWEGGGDGHQRAIAAAAVQAGAHLTAVNEVCLENFPPELRGKVTIIPNGSEVSRAQSSLTKGEARERWGIPATAKLVLFVGRFAREKNLQALVDAMEFLPDWWLLAAGPKFSMPSLPSDSSRMVFPGSVDPPGDLYRAADVLCMPSNAECHSLTLIEANLAGVPVVSYDYPAMRFLTEKHGPLARLVPVGCSSLDLAAEIVAATAAKPELDDFPIVPAPEWYKSDYHPEPGEEWRKDGLFRWQRYQMALREWVDVSRVQQIAVEHYTAEKMAGRWQSYLLRLAGGGGGGTAVGGTTK